ncbi:hypothetical protein NEMBOFW57_005118 [Staphylotrichum longicolle]|uniref:Rhomboid family membrane protein n=1 Tax=Staphylotrichum longicolle TaxID=669026 RepID=A0AAD4EW38_9PEZI|nr:hypothetical protein NEMBOFW57_005118 [Staphylotrichum longicolle]
MSSSPSPSPSGQQQQPPPPQPPAEATTTPPLPTPNPITHNAALAMAVLCPIALLLPARGGRGKSLLQNLILGGGAVWAVDTLATDYTGKSVTARSAERWGSLLGIAPKSEEEKEAERKKKEEVGAGGFLGALPTERAARNKALMEAERKRRAEAEGRAYVPRGEGESKGLWERVWMGGEKEGWKERRLEESAGRWRAGRGMAG